MKRYILPLIVDADTDSGFPKHLPVTVFLHDGSFTEIPRGVFDENSILLPSDPVFAETSLKDMNMYLRKSVQDSINNAKENPDLEA